MGTEEVLAGAKEAGEAEIVVAGRVSRCTALR